MYSRSGHLAFVDFLFILLLAFISMFILALLLINPIPKKSDIQAYQTLTTSVTRALRAINKLPKGKMIPIGLKTPAQKAIGGPISKGQPYLVGEGGPELIIPNQPGQVADEAPSLDQPSPNPFAPVVVEQVLRDHRHEQ